MKQSQQSDALNNRMLESESRPDEKLALELDNLMSDASGDVAIGELDDAITKFKRCTELAPEHFDSWHALGMAYMKTGRYKEAIEAGLRATELRPDDQLAWSSLSLFYVRDKQIEAAEAAGAKARVISWTEQLKKKNSKNTPA
ncbi:MAG: tetratricopeptide repeat protein [Chthoniobacterales bacterium]